MKLSTETYPLDLQFGYCGAVKALKEIGFDCYDLSIFDLGQEGSRFGGADWREKALALRKYADGLDLECNQSHGPYPCYKPTNEKWNAEIFDWCVRALEITSLVGGKICVLHPYHTWTPKENAERIYLPLLPYCKKFGVKIAVENMWQRDGSGAAIPAACNTAEDFLAHMALLDPEYFCACVDIGHAEMVGKSVSAAQLILALGDRLGALHVHDNDLKEDLHTAPYCGKIDWESVFAALRHIGYGGEFTFEADGFVRAFPEELRLDATAMLYRTGKYMVGRIQSAD